MKMTKDDFNNSNRYLILLYSVIVLLIVSFSCAWKNVDVSLGMGERRDHCIGNLFQKLGSIMYLWDSFPSWTFTKFLNCFLGSVWWAFVFGMIMTFFTWTVIKLDSAVPGYNPPSPFSPTKIRSASGHNFHSGYLLAIVNGVTFGILSLGIPS